ncbi:MAG: preprotein translocase subunit SecG [Phycisphaerae bacterium]
MTAFPMLAVSFFSNLVAVAFLICAVILILIILVQKGKGGGLSAAFGGGMASGLLGSKTGDFLTWVTIVVAGVFLALAVAMAKLYKPGISDFGGGPPQQTQQSPAQQQPQGSEPPLAPAHAGSESADANSPGR